MTVETERESCSVQTLSEAEYPAWRALVERSNQGSVYHLPEYLDALCTAAGGRFRILGVMKSGELQGGAALYETSSPWGSVIANRLLLYYQGIILRRQETKYPSQRTAREIETLRALKSALDAIPAARLLMNNRSTLSDLRVFQDGTWTVRPSYTYVVPIADTAAQWDLVEKNCRRLIDRCREQGMQYTEDDDFESFFRLHQQISDRKDAPLYLPKEKFLAFFKSLQSQGLARLAHARMTDGRSIAAQLVLHCKHPVTHTAAAGADAEYLRLGASAYLRWKAFESLSADGYEANDLTDAALNPVTHFKSQFGGRLETTWVLMRPDSAGYQASAQYKKARRIAASAVRKLAERVKPKPVEKA